MTPPPPSDEASLGHDDVVYAFNRKLFWIFTLAALAFIAAGMVFVI